MHTLYLLPKHTKISSFTLDAKNQFHMSVKIEPRQCAEMRWREREKGDGEKKR